MSLTVNPLYVGQKSTAANIDIWLVALQERVTKLEEELKLKDLTINDLNKKVAELENKPQSMNAPAEFWSKFPKEASVGIASLIAKEKSDCSKKEKNLIIFGLAEPSATEPQDKTSEDTEMVTKLLKELKIEIKVDAIKIIRFNNKTSSTTAPASNPRPVKICFDSVENKLRVLKAAKTLKDSSDFKKVFINQDLTQTELAIQIQLRKERNTKNDQLQEMDSNGRKYGLHKFGGQIDTKFYWGIRNGEIKRIKIPVE